MKKTKISQVLIFNNLNVAVFDENEEQVTELQQKNLIQMWAEKVEKLGYDLNGVRLKYDIGNYTLVKSKKGEWRLE